jgi:hypothetical protein
MICQANDWYGSPDSPGESSDTCLPFERWPAPAPNTKAASVLIDLGTCPTKTEAGLVHILLPPIKNKLESETIRFYLPPFCSRAFPKPNER